MKKMKIKKKKNNKRFIKELSIYEIQTIDAYRGVPVKPLPVPNGI